MRTQTSRRRWRGVLLMTLAGVAGGAVTHAWARKDDGQPSAEADGGPRRVHVATVEESAASSELVMHGTLLAKDRSNLAFVVGGRLVARKVDVGDRVEKGQVLARIDPAAYRHAEQAAAADLAQVEARAKQLARDERRAAKLEAEGFAPRAEREQAQTAQSALAAQRTAALAQLSETRRQHGETVLRAPYDGIVRAVFGQPGEVLSPGVPVLAVADDRGVEAHVDAPESTLPWLRPGQVARIEVPSLGRELSGEVSAVAWAAGPSGLYRVRLAVQGQDLAPGQGVMVRVQPPRALELRVPLAAVVDPSGDDAAVWVVRDDAVHEVAVFVRGLRGEGEAAALAIAPRGDASLEPGAEVVVAGHAHLLEGDRVDVRASSNAQAGNGGGTP